MLQCTPVAFINTGEPGIPVGELLILFGAMIEAAAASTKEMLTPSAMLVSDAGAPEAVVPTFMLNSRLKPPVPGQVPLTLKVGTTRTVLDWDAAFVMTTLPAE